MILNNSQPISLDTEIRKLPPAHIYKLSMLLNISDSWRKLMAIVPKENSEHYKFSADHFSLVEQASRQQKRGCAEIFFDEWSTMGKKRPTLKILLELLEKSELYRIADYVAINILNWKEGPKRPNAGPAAQIDFSTSLLESNNDIMENASLSGDVQVEESFANEDGNLEEGRPEEKVAYQIPAFLNDISFSNFSEASIGRTSLGEIESISECTSSELIHEIVPKTSDNEQKGNGTGNEAAYQIPAFLNDISFSNFSEAYYKPSDKIDKTSGEFSDPQMVNESSAKVSDGCEISVKLPRCLHEMNFSSTILRSNGQEKSLSKENEAGYQIPAFLNDINFSNFSEVSESEKSSDQVGISDEFSSKSIKKSKVPNTDEICAKLPLCLNEMTLSSSQSQEVISSNAADNESSKVVVSRLLMEFSNSQ